MVTLTESRIILLGLKHSGKSTQGRKLAEVAGYQFIDIDLEIERNHFKHSKSSSKSDCREIYRKIGKQGFLELEYEAAEAIHEKKQVIIACGGGIADNKPALDLLKNSGLVIYLEEDEKILYHRIMIRGIPAFLSPEHPEEDFHGIYSRRHEVYRSAADLIIPLEGKPLDSGFHKIVSTLKEKSYAR